MWIDKSWIHTEVNPGWNKLIGISDWPHHHRHSNRIVWRCIDGLIVFGHYVYQNGKWSVERFKHGYVHNRWVEGCIRNERGRYIAEMGNESSLFERSGKCSFYMLWPYFGGLDTAPHDMSFMFHLK